MITHKMLNIDEQITHLKEKGVLFNIMDENDAKEVLSNRNNYFKISSYRKNYIKYQSGQNKGKYCDLEFAYLYNLSSIDYRLRYCILQISLDIEHNLKLQLLNTIQNHNEDGYSIIEDYKKSLDDNSLNIFNTEINRAAKTVYNYSLHEKYKDNIPVWALLEIISFGSLINFYKFIANRYSNQEMLDNYYLLLRCKELRNACAHNSCVINDVGPDKPKYTITSKIKAELKQIPDLSPNFVNSKVKNDRVIQIITTLYLHKTLITSSSSHKRTSKILQELTNKINENSSFYTKNSNISGFFNLLIKIIDYYFPDEIK